MKPNSLYNDRNDLSWLKMCRWVVIRKENYNPDPYSLSTTLLFLSIFPYSETGHYKSMQSNNSYHLSLLG